MRNRSNSEIIEVDFSVNGPNKSLRKGIARAFALRFWQQKEMLNVCRGIDGIPAMQESPQ